MISRRPNTRASIENAPGPRITMASKMLTAKTTEMYDPNRVQVQAGTSENPMQAAPNATMTPANAVRKPSQSRVPEATPTKPANHVAAEGLGSRR
jgi:hypothetical protein